MKTLIIRIILLFYLSRETKCQPQQAGVSFSMAIPEPMILQPRQNNQQDQNQAQTTQQFIPQNPQSSQFQTFPGQFPQQQIPGSFQQQQIPGSFQQQQIPGSFQQQQIPGSFQGSQQPGIMNPQLQQQPGMPQFQQFQTPQNQQSPFPSNQNTMQSFPPSSFQSQPNPTFTNNGMNYPPTGQMPQPITGTDFLQRPNPNQFSSNQGQPFGAGNQYPNLQQQPSLNNIPSTGMQNTFVGQNPQNPNGVGGPSNIPSSTTGLQNNPLAAQGSTPGTQPGQLGTQSATGIQPSTTQTSATLQNPTGAPTVQNPSGTQSPAGTAGQILSQDNLQFNNPETQAAASMIMKQLVSLLNDPTTRDAFVLMMTDFRNILSNPQAFRVIQSYNAGVQDRLNNPQIYNNNVPQLASNNGGLGTTTITGTNGGSMYNKHPLQQPTDLASIITSTTSSLADLIKYKGRILTNLLRDEVSVKSKAVDGLLGDIPGVNSISRMGTNFLDQAVNQVDKTFNPLLNSGNGGTTGTTNSGTPGFGAGLTRMGSGVLDGVGSFMNMGGSGASSVPGSTLPNNNSNLNGNNYPQTSVTTTAATSNNNYPNGYNEFNRPNKKR